MKILTPEATALGREPLMQQPTARRLLAFTLLFMALIQLVLLVKIGNGLSPFDGFDEADALHSGEAYATDGFTLHHGLPRLLYGSRLRTFGALGNHLETNGLVKASF